ncbi:MAG: rhomboid family intramembrane serine protease [Anaerolineales bacterium]
MIPIGDYSPTKRRPFLTYTLILINVLVFLWQQTLSQVALFNAFNDYAVVPALIVADPLSLEAFLDSLRSMFMHGGWLHLGSNMLYLWVFGDNIEDRLGRPLYLTFYLVAGFAAVFAQVIIDTESTIPMVGASGAIAGVLGGYLLLHPARRVRNLVFLGFFIFFIDLPAVVVLGFWFVLQLVSGLASLGVETSAGGGTAFFAHIGGFIAGMALMSVHRLTFGAPPPEPLPASRTRYGQFASSMRRRPPGAPQREPRSKDTNPNRLYPRQVAPRPDLTDQQRLALRERNHALLVAWDESAPVWMISDDRTYYGRVLELTPEKVLIRESDGSLFNIPLENIARVS